jgi:hypothetical protein
MVTTYCYQYQCLRINFLNTVPNKVSKILPNATSQARFNWEWWDRLISLSLSIFSRARTINISLVLEVLCIVV